MTLKRFVLVFALSLLCAGCYHPHHHHHHWHWR